MRIVKLAGDSGTVEAGGLRRSVNFSLLKGVRKGDYVLVHAGFAIERIKEQEAKKTLKALRGIDEVYR